jgi:Xaa-Pro aminopeptidase
MNRVDMLRILIKEHKCDAYLITDSDAHYTFYSLARQDRRINWITECQAQCGLAIVTLEHGAAFQAPPNYRYLANSEMNLNVWVIVDDLFKWIAEHELLLKNIGYDPYFTPLFVIEQFSNLTQCHLAKISASMNLIDTLSHGETSIERSLLTPIWALDEERFAGQSSQNKLKTLRQDYLTDGNKKFTLVTTAMDEIAWLLNLRANDMQCNPLFYSFMFVSHDQVIVFTDNPHPVNKIHFLDIRPQNSFLPFLATIKSNDIWIDDRANMAVVQALGSPPVRTSRSPIQQMKEIKNNIELNGFRECHYRDCVAVCQTFEWLEQQQQLSADKNIYSITEFDVCKYLEDRQREQSFFIGIAFDTISAADSNTALVEFSPAPPSANGDNNAKIIGANLYYLDAGANYLDGTTDMTRTLHFGEPTKKQIECYTLLLRGILAVEMTSFRTDQITTGYRIDALLQQYFCASHYPNIHIVFGHGVSHGQGVIEGGISISDNHSLANRVPIQSGMVVTLEPGIYLEGEWGIRIENVYAVEKEEDNPDWMHFVPLTLLPYCHKLIDFDMLSRQELVWIDKYHQRCLEKVNGGQWMKSEIEKFKRPFQD